MGPDSAVERGNWEKSWFVVKYRDALWWAVQNWLNGSRCLSGCGLGLGQGNVLDSGPYCPMQRSNFGGKGHVQACRTTLPWAVQKWPNRSRCHLGCGLVWAQWSMCYMRCTLAPYGEYHWTIRVLWRCALFLFTLTTCNYCYCNYYK